MPLRSRPRRNDLEFQIQSGFVKLMMLEQLRYPELRLAFHPPNGGQRPAIVNRKGKRVSVAGAKLKAMGARRDVPDWVLPVARGGYVGLWIEFKVPGEKANKDQAVYHELLRLEGHQVHVCTDLEAAWKIVREYLSLPKRGVL